MKRADRKAVVRSIIQPYLTAKKDRTITSQYERIAPAPDGMVRTVLSPVVTETGRLASGESFLDKYSTNLQNLSKKESYKDELYRVRDCFVAAVGMSFVALDLDKAEAVIVAMESEDWAFYEALIGGADIHTDLAADSFHEGNTKAVSKHERQVCKNVTYASLYMAGIPRITKTINSDSDSFGFKLTEDDVEKVYKVLLQIHPLEQWWNNVWVELNDPNLYGGYRWLQNALGFRRMFYNPDDHKLHKEAVNFPPQSTVAGVIDNAMIQAWETFDEPGVCELLHQVHDELIFQVRDDKLSLIVPELIGLMETPFECRGREVYMPSGAVVGKRWDAFRGADSEPLDPQNTLGRMVAFE